MEIHHDEKQKIPPYHVKQTIYYIMSPISLIAWFFTLGHAILVGYEFEEIKGLKEGYFGYNMDGSDGQWNAFSDAFPLLLTVATIQILGGRAIRKLTERNPSVQYDYLIWYNLIFGIGYLTYIFKIGIIFWFFYTAFLFLVCKLMSPYRSFPTIIWTLAIWILYNNYYYKGGMHYLDNLEPLFLIFTDDKQMFQDFMDYVNSDVIVEWSQVFNMTLLRILSWAFDRYWSLNGLYHPNTNRHIKHCKLCEPESYKFCYKIRSETHLEAYQYKSFRDYLAYLTYIPLFITGPAITYNAFISQIKLRQNSYGRGKVFTYAYRAINNFIFFEIYRHISYSYTITRNNPKILAQLPAHVCIFMCINNLTFIWFKFTTIWRFSRAWAMVDGLDSPENMNRCLFNSINFEGFWRMWHRGFNQWLIRYIFLPLGGSRFKMLNIWIVFTFVAIWHDFQLNLILWAWGICFLMMPEIAIKEYFNKPKRFWLWRKWWFQQLVHVAAAALLAFLNITNFVGFGIGYERMIMIFQKFQGISGLYSFIIVLFMYYLNTYSTFWIRDREAQNKNYKGY